MLLHVQGTLRRDVITCTGGTNRPHRTQVVYVEEPCTHEETFGNLCTTCGVDVTQYALQYSSIQQWQANIDRRLDNYLTSVPNEARATINTAHNNTALKISQRKANEFGQETTKRLLDAKKLSLVVDLDQTIIQATVEPTVAEWQKDPDHPNYPAVKDIKAFQLNDDGPGMRGCWYYIKLRPGLVEFLEEMAKLYELHVYTMGTRSYAQHVCQIVDPQRRIFGDRILSRDESGSMQAKNLQRLFPVDTDMVVIIDDRADVWSWSPNLIKVLAYDFFVGIGDINAGFLPKQNVIAKPKPAPKVITNGTKEAEEAGDENAAPSSDLEAQLVAMAGTATDADFTAQTEAQGETIAAQIEDRPLLRRQEALDQLVEAEEANGDNSDTSSEHSQKHRHNLLVDNDNELENLQKNLTNVHHAFYEDYDQQKKRISAGRVAELRGDKGSPKKPSLVDDVLVVPDIKVIMPAMKQQVLRGVVICFTGVIPQGHDHKKYVCPKPKPNLRTNISNRHDLGMWVQSFGARINTTLTKSTTHVVAHKDRRTGKVRQATQHENIQIVSISWLLECFSRWEHVDEGPYLIDFGRDSGPQDSLPFDDFDEGVTLTPSEDGGDVPELPDDMESEPLSPTFETKGMDWNEADDELKDFMGSDGESISDLSDSEAEASDSSIGSNKSGRSQSRKRKRAPSSVDGTETGESLDASDPSAENAAGSALQKRRKKASERTTGLANVTLPEKSSGLPSPETTGPDDEVNGAGEDEEVEENGADEDEEADDDYDPELEAALLEELNSPSNDEAEGWS